VSTCVCVFLSVYIHAYVHAYHKSRDTYIDRKIDNMYVHIYACVSMRVHSVCAAFLLDREHILSRTHSIENTFSRTLPLYRTHSSRDRHSIKIMREHQCGVLAGACVCARVCPFSSCSCVFVRVHACPWRAPRRHVRLLPQNVFSVECVL
jgi:hypothetical protein